MKRLRYIAILFTAILLNGCGIDEVIFDQPFVYIESEDGTKETRLADNVSDEKTYYIYMSSGLLNRNVTVDYEIITGDGLTKGTDYEISSSTSSPITFIPGIYRMPIRIVWKKNRIDPTKDNTMRIVLTGCSENFTLGYPGPDQNNKQHLITRISGIWE